MPDDVTLREFAVTFVAPGPIGWLANPSRTQWRWARAGKIYFDGADTVIEGRRGQVFGFSRKQVIRFASSDVQNVVQKDREISCEVRLARSEPLRCWAKDSDAAKELVSHWPAVHTPEFSRSLADQKGFTAALDQIGGGVVVTPALVAVNVLVFAFLVLKGINAISPSGFDLIPWGSNFGVQTVGGEWWRLFTSMFLHFGLLHLVFNMLALGSIGPTTERLLGSGRFLLLYLFAGLCGSVASLLWNPFVNSAGASGAIFGVIGALLAIVVNPRTEVPPTVSSAQRKNALIFIAYNLMNGFTHRGIDNACHIGGLVGGFVMGWFLARPLTLEARQNGSQGIVLGTALGVLALYSLAWPLAHPTPEKLTARVFQRSLLNFSAESRLANEQEKKLQGMLDSHSITEEQWGRMTLIDVVPYLRTAEDEFIDMKVPSGTKYSDARNAVVGFLEARRLGTEYRAEAARDHDQSKADWGNELLQRSRKRDAVAADLINKLH